MTCRGHGRCGHGRTRTRHRRSHPQSGIVLRGVRRDHRQLAAQATEDAVHGRGECLPLGTLPCLHSTDPYAKGTTGDLHSSTHTPAHRRPQRRHKQKGDRRQTRPDLGQSCHAGDRTLLTGLRRALAGGDGRISLTPNPARASRNSFAFCPPPTIGRLGRARRLSLPHPCALALAVALRQTRPNTSRQRPALFP